MNDWRKRDVSSRLGKQGSAVSVLRTRIASTSVRRNTHGVSGEADAVVFVAGTADLPAATGGGKQRVYARATDAVSARCLTGLTQSGRAADTLVARVDAADELDRRRLDERVEVCVDRQTRQLHARQRRQYQCTHQGPECQRPDHSYHTHAPVTCNQFAHTHLHHVQRPRLSVTPLAVTRIKHKEGWSHRLTVANVKFSATSRGRLKITRCI